MPKISCIGEKIPKLFIFNYPNTNEYRMFNIAEKKYIGKMSIEDRLDLYISDLEIVKSEQRKGYGTKFIEYAKQLSLFKGLGGRLRVLASPKLSSENNPPHVFYRKLGFTSSDKCLIKKIDDCIKNKQKFELKDSKAVYMYYPAI